MGCVLPPTPFNLIDLFFNLKRFQVVEFRFVGLKLGMEFVLASLLLRCVNTAVLYVAKRAVAPCVLVDGVLTVSFLSKSTTLPPLSPVAK